MNPDMFLAIGLVFGALSVPGILASLSENRPPRVSILTSLIALGCIFTAFYLRPNGYGMDEIPDAFMRGLGSFFP